MSPFHVGQRVVCIDNRFRPTDLRSKAILIWRTLRGIRTIPRLNGVYTVSAVGLNRRGAVCLRLVELPQDGMYSASGFRPLVEKSTDISIFHRILRDVNERAKVPAQTVSTPSPAIRSPARLPVPGQILP